MLGHPCRDAAEDQSPETSPSVGTEDDEVGPFGIGGRHDHFGRVPFPDQEGRPGGVSLRSTDDRLRSHLGPSPFLVDAPEESSTGKSQPSGVHHAEHEQLRAVLHSEADGFSGGRLGRARQVGREQHAPDRRWDDRPRVFGKRFHAGIIGRGAAGAQ